MRISEKKRELNKQIFSLENQVIDIEKSNKNLEKGIAQSTDDNYMEKVAREELDMQKAGEKVVSFVFSKQETIQSEEQNISKKWFSWIGDTWQ